jgi:hypothetical protein
MVPAVREVWAFAMDSPPFKKSNAIEYGRNYIIRKIGA